MFILSDYQFRQVLSIRHAILPRSFLHLQLASLQLMMLVIKMKQEEEEEEEN